MYEPASFGHHQRSQLNFLLGRRRKIRCTYKPDHPETCNECRLRGAVCIDQEHSAKVSPDIGMSTEPERYSLRERVAYLETVVQGLAKRVDETNVANTASEYSCGVMTRLA